MKMPVKAWIPGQNLHLDFLTHLLSNLVGEYWKCVFKMSTQLLKDIYYSSGTIETFLSVIRTTWTDFSSTWEDWNHAVTIAGYGAKTPLTRDYAKHLQKLGSSPTSLKLLSIEE